MSTFVMTLQRKTYIDYTQHMTGPPEVKYDVAKNRPDVSATMNYSVHLAPCSLYGKKVITSITISAIVAEGVSCCVKQQK